MSEKLIELLLEVDSVCDVDECRECEAEGCFIHRAADNLIANGVTFADVTDTNVGKWIPVSERLPEKGGIRAMSDEELAWELMQFRFDAYGKASGDESVLPDSQQKIAEWLKQPAEVDE